MASSTVSAGGGGTLATLFGSVHVPSQYAGIIQMAAAQYHIRPALLAAQIQTESSFNPNARSSAGAVGIAQFEPATAASLGVNPYDPQSAILGMAKLDAQNIARFGSEASALAAYNLGAGAIPSGGGVPAAAKGYVSRILGLAGGTNTTNANADGTTTQTPPSSPIADVFTHLTSAAFYRRVGLGVLGAIVIGLSLWFMLGRTNTGQAIQSHVAGTVKHAAEAAVVA